MPTTTSPSFLERYRIEAAVALVGLLVVTGLWLANRGDGDGGAAPLAPTTTTEPADADPGPAGGGDGSTEPTADAGEEPPVDEDAGELDAAGDSAAAVRAVLRSGDLPSGWSRRPAGEASSELCPGQDPFATTPATGSARAGFRRGDSAYLVGLVADFPSEAAAAAFVRTAEAAAGACDGYTTSSLRGVGDEAIEAARDVDGPDSLVQRSRVYVARVGDRVAAISSAAFGPVDEALARRLLEVQVERLS